MTNPTHSHITIVADRSGSMSSIRNDAEGGINSFIADQKKVKGTCSLYFVDFDTSYEQVYDGDLAKMRKYSLSPRGGTALYDAIAKAIAETGERLAALPEDERPGNVFFIVSTDGGENSSREFSVLTNGLEKVTEMIKRQEEEWKWTFIFLAAGPEAFTQSQAFVGTRMSSVNTVSGQSAQYGETYLVTSANVGATRSGATDVYYGADIKDRDKKEDADASAP